jgi:hypothetical protein
MSKRPFDPVGRVFFLRALAPCLSCPVPCWSPPPFSISELLSSTSGLALVAGSRLFAGTRAEPAWVERP